MDPSKLITCFEHYLALEGTTISRPHAEQTMLKKLNHSLTEDISVLLPAGVAFTDSDAIAAFEKIWFNLIVRMKGNPWKLSEQTIELIRKEKNPAFLRK